MVTEPVVSKANPKNRRSHNTAEPINCISKVLHVLEPPKHPLYNYNIFVRLRLFAKLFFPLALSTKRMGDREWNDHLRIMIVV